MSIRISPFLALLRGGACALVLLGLLALPQRVFATTFDWNGTYATWNGGAPTYGATVTNTYDSDATHAGSDISISVHNNNTRNSGAAWTTGYPAVNTHTTGGTNPAQNALQLRMDQNNSAGIAVTINFLYTTGVNNVTLTLWDIDASGTQFTDLINNIHATLLNGTTVAATLISTSAENKVTGTGLNQAVSGTGTADDTTGNANVTISFSTSQPISSVTFTWSNQTYSGAQAIGLADFSYTVVPEKGVAAVALCLCGGVLLFGLCRSRFIPSKER